MQASVYPTDRHAVFNGLDFEHQLRPLRQRINNLAYCFLRNRDDAEDITQETFVRAWTHYDHFDVGGSHYAWISRIAMNLCLDTIRRRRRQCTISLNTPPAWSHDGEGEGYQVADSTQDPATRLQEAEVDESLLWALRNLPASHRRCIQLLEQEHSYEEIGALMGCPVGTIRSRLHRARALIRNRMETKRSG
jgi:RNA polymerase sigma-70 factor (ECF subfamily)